MFNWVFQKEYRQKSGKNLIKEIKWEEGDVLSWDQQNVEKKYKKDLPVFISSFETRKYYESAFYRKCIILYLKNTIEIYFYSELGFRHTNLENFKLDFWFVWHSSEALKALFATQKRISRIDFFVFTFRNLWNWPTLQNIFNFGNSGKKRLARRSSIGQQHDV